MITGNGQFVDGHGRLFVLPEVSITPVMRKPQNVNAPPPNPPASTVILQPRVQMPNAVQPTIPMPVARNQLNPAAEGPWMARAPLVSTVTAPPFLSPGRILMLAPLSATGNGPVQNIRYPFVPNGGATVSPMHVLMQRSPVPLIIPPVGPLDLSRSSAGGNAVAAVRPQNDYRSAMIGLGFANSKAAPPLAANMMTPAQPGAISMPGSAQPVATGMSILVQPAATSTVATAQPFASNITISAQSMTTSTTVSAQRVATSTTIPAQSVAHNTPISTQTEFQSRTTPVQPVTFNTSTSVRPMALSTTTSVRSVTSSTTISVRPVASSTTTSVSMQPSTTASVSSQTPIVVNSINVEEDELLKDFMRSEHPVDSSGRRTNSLLNFVEETGSRGMASSDSKKHLFSLMEIQPMLKPSPSATKDPTKDFLAKIGQRMKKAKAREKSKHKSVNHVANESEHREQHDGVQGLKTSQQSDTGVEESPSCSNAQKEDAADEECVDKTESSTNVQTKIFRADPSVKVTIDKNQNTAIMTSGKWKAKLVPVTGPSSTPVAKIAMAVVKRPSAEASEQSAKKICIYGDNTGRLVPPVEGNEYFNPKVVMKASQCDQFHLNKISTQAAVSKKEVNSSVPKPTVPSKVQKIIAVAKKTTKIAALPSYKCRVCRLKFPTLKDVKDHVCKKGYTCDDCNPNSPVKFTRIMDLMEHLEEVHLPKKHTCDECSQVVYSKTELKLHTVKFHPLPDDKTETEPASEPTTDVAPSEEPSSVVLFDSAEPDLGLAGQSAASNGNQVAAPATASSTSHESEIASKNCQTDAATVQEQGQMSLFDIHDEIAEDANFQVNQEERITTEDAVQTQDNSQDSENEELPFKCAGCKKRFRTSTRFDHHITVCTSVPSAALNQTSSTYRPRPRTWKSLLSDHEKPHCVQCGKTSYKEETLNLHQQNCKGTHDVVSSIECPYCKDEIRTFSHRGYLNYHVRQFHPEVFDFDFYEDS